MKPAVTQRRSLASIDASSCLKKFTIPALPSLSHRQNRQKHQQKRVPVESQVATSSLSTLAPVSLAR